MSDLPQTVRDDSRIEGGVSAYDAAVEAMAKGLCWHTVVCTGDHQADARAALAALVESEAVREALKRALEADPTYRYEGMGNASVDVRSAHMTILAALTEGGAGGG